MEDWEQSLAISAKRTGLNTQPCGVPVFVRLVEDVRPACQEVHAPVAQRGVEPKVFSLLISFHRMFHTQMETNMVKMTPKLNNYREYVCALRAIVCGHSFFLGASLQHAGYRWLTAGV